jgi:hypothetical protein
LADTLKGKHLKYSGTLDRSEYESLLNVFIHRPLGDTRNIFG